MGQELTSLGDVPVCVDKKAHDKFTAKAAAKDNLGLKKMILQRRAFLVSSKTQGPQTWQSGWIDHGRIKSP